jgi:cobalt/nickel transport system ATP-binding protein
MPGQPVLIAADNIGYTFPDGVPALENVSLCIEEGERVALIGANGAGKSTLLLALAELLPVEGSVRRMPSCRVAIVFQDPDDQLFMPSVIDEVAFAPLNRGVAKEEARDRSLAALERFDLGGLEDRHPSALSLGQRKRLCLAVAMAMEPGLLLLDEPFAGLDPAGCRDLAGWLRSLDTGFVLATHNLPLAAELTARCVTLAAGRVGAEGPTAEIVADTTTLRALGL